jgi:hypothetical protein
MPRQHTEHWLRQQKLAGKSSGSWGTRTEGSAAQIGLKYRKQRRARHVLSPTVQTRSLQHRLVVPSREGQGRKPRMIKPHVSKVPIVSKVPVKPEAHVEIPKKKLPKHAVKMWRIKPKHQVGMTHLEDMHLLAYARNHEIDSAEIDHSLTYWENKEHLQDMAKGKGSFDIEMEEEREEEAVSQHELYLSQLKNELEQQGFKVSGPTN